MTSAYLYEIHQLQAKIYSSVHVCSAVAKRLESGEFPESHTSGNSYMELTKVVKALWEIAKPYFAPEDELCHLIQMSC